MISERKNIFSRGDLWAVLFLLACLMLGTTLTLYQKSNQKLPPELLIETVKLTDNQTQVLQSPAKSDLSAKSDQPLANLSEQAVHQDLRAAQSQKSAKIDSPIQAALRININTAPADSLELLPGIGPSYARRIVEYRARHGKFQNIAEIIRIKGIGTKTFEKIAKFITVE